MNELLPKGEELRRAIRSISERLQDQPDRPWQPLVEEAIFKFDLSPRDADLLLDFFYQRAADPEL